MLLRFAFWFISRHFHSQNLSITATDVAWGGFFSLWAIMEYREEASPMMLRDGALLMRGGGRKAGGERTRGQEAVVSVELKDPDEVIRKADGRRGRTDLVVIESCRELPRAV
jgi:hypothetical protein